MTQLLGPVFSFDLLRLSRRTRYFVLRFVVCLLVFFAFYVCYASFEEHVRLRAAGGVVIGGTFYSSGLARGNYLSDLARDAARFGYSFFVFFLLGQIGLILLVTPVVVAGTLAEEKQRQTLEYLLATDLTNREIVLGKLLSRLLLMTTLVLGCFPVLAFAQWFGGVEPELILLALAACVATLVGTAGLALWCAVRGHRLRQMMLWTYGCLMVPFVAWFGVGYVYFVRIGLTLAEAERLRLLLAGLGLLTPAGALANCMEDVNRTGLIHAGVWQYLFWYCVTQLLVGLLFALLATRQLRSAYLRQQAHEVLRKGKVVRRKVGPVWPNYPLAWKEVVLEPGFRLRWWGWGAALLFTLYWLGSLLWTYLEELPEWPPTVFQWKGAPGYAAYTALTQSLPWFVVAPLVLALIVAGVRGATTLAHERDQQTWDTLMSSPVSLRAVLIAKAWGCLQSLWPFLVFAFLVSTIGWFLHSGSGPTPFLIALGFVVFSTFAALVGLFFSATSASAPRAVLATLLTLGLMVGLPLVMYRLFIAWVGADASGNVAEGVIAILSVAEWIWVPACLVVLVLIATRFLPKRVQNGVYLSLRLLLIGLPVFFMTLMTLMALAATFDVGLTLGELSAFLSPPFLFYLNLGSLGNRHQDTLNSASLLVLILYAAGIALLWLLTQNRLRRSSGRVDGTRPPKKRRG